MHRKSCKTLVVSALNEFLDNFCRQRFGINTFLSISELKDLEKNPRSKIGSKIFFPREQQLRNYSRYVWTINDNNNSLKWLNDPCLRSWQMNNYLLLFQVLFATHSIKLKTTWNIQFHLNIDANVKVKRRFRSIYWWERRDSVQIIKNCS